MDILKAAQCMSLAKQLRQHIRPGDTMHSWWDVIFDLEAFGRGKPEQAMLREKGVDWHIQYAERLIKECENNA